MPAVSVVIPVYNVEDKLRDCADSLLDQTFRDLELIFVNDASTDGSLAILREYEAARPGLVRVIDNKVNLRQGGARNAGIRAAKGEYIGFVDSDDFVSPRMYEKMYARMRETGADAVFVMSTEVEDGETYRSYTENGRISGAAPKIGWRQRLSALDGRELDDGMRQDLLCCPIGGVWSGLWRRSLITENELFFPEHVRYEDNYWAALTKCYLRKAAFVPEILYMYRINPASTTHQRNPEYLKDRMRIEKSLREEAGRRGLLERFPEAWEYIYTFRYTFNSYHAFVKRFDDLPPAGLLKGLMKDLRREYPKWRGNRYYRELQSASRRRKDLCAYLAPVTYARLNHLVRK